MMNPFDANSQPTWGDDHHTFNNAHFDNELNHNDFHQDWSHNFDDNNAHTHDLHTDSHADMHACDAHWHEADAYDQAFAREQDEAFSIVNEHLNGSYAVQDEPHWMPHHMEFGATYTKNADAPTIIEREPNILYRTQHDGSAVQICKSLLEHTTHYLCNIEKLTSAGATGDSTFCRIEAGGCVYSGYQKGDYLGKVQEGNIYNSEGTFIGKADTPAQGAAHLYFLGV
jgi:hypothetical protein